MSFSCHYYAKNEKNEIILNSNTACWAGFRRWYTAGTLKPKYIYIDYECNCSFNVYDNILKRTVQLINNITHCSIVNFNNKKCIKYKPITNGHYSSNLVLLNFIRMIWYQPRPIDYDIYSELISRSSQGIDSLLFLMRCVKESVSQGQRYGFADHNLITRNIKPKKTKELMNYKGNSMESFLDM